MTSVHILTAAFILAAVVAVWFCLSQNKQWWLMLFVVAAAFIATRFLTTV